MNDAAGVPTLSHVACAMLELLSPHALDTLNGTTAGSSIGIWGFVAECHRLALTKHVEGFGPNDIVTLIRRHPACPWHALATLESDVADGWRNCLAKAREALERRMKAREVAETLFDPWAELPPPEWPRGVLRLNYEATIAALAKRDGCDLGALTMAFVVPISGAAHKDMRFEPFQHAGWQVPPIIYAMPIADSGFRKTPLIKAAFGSIIHRDQQEWQEYQRALAEYEMAPDQHEEDKPEEPSPLIVDDANVEELLAILTRSPRGAPMLRDEIAPLFDFRRYSKGVGATERAFYLRAYEGDMVRVHRMGRATDHGETIGLTVFGCVQPDRLADFKDLGSDGLLQRFVPPVIAERRLSEPERLTRNAPSTNKRVISGR